MGARDAIRPEDPIPQGRKLSVVVVVVNVVVGVVCRPVDDRLQDLGKDAEVVMDTEGPDEDEDERQQEHAAVEREEERVDVP